VIQCRERLILKAFAGEEFFFYGSIAKDAQ
jgi:hypothetical protein